MLLKMITISASIIQFVQVGYTVITGHFRSGLLCGSVNLILLCLANPIVLHFLDKLTANRKSQTLCCYFFLNQSCPIMLIDFSVPV